MVNEGTSPVTLDYIKLTGPDSADLPRVVEASVVVYQDDDAHIGAMTIPSGDRDSDADTFQDWDRRSPLGGAVLQPGEKKAILVGVRPNHSSGLGKSEAYIVHYHTDNWFGRSDQTLQMNVGAEFEQCSDDGSA